jgi:hypothetical protein
MYVVQMPDGKFVLKSDGWNHFVKRPCDASRYPDKESAEAGKVGHHRDMGGSGFKGRIVPYSRVKWMNDHPNYRD